jgi:G protein beta subunit-like protein
MANNVILVTGSYDHTLVFWDAQQGHATSTIEYGDKQIVNRIEISLDKKYLGVAASLTATYYDLFSNKQ